jgi:hypothetical protein
MQDTNTLRLATVALDAPTLQRFIQYQTMLVEQLSQANQPEWAGRYAFAHTKAQELTGLDTVQLQRLRAMVADVAGRRATLEAVRDRLKVAAANDPRRPAANVDLHRLESTVDWEARYGKATVELLLAQEQKLVELHRRLAALEGGGHLHTA